MDKPHILANNVRGELLKATLSGIDKFISTYTQIGSSTNFIYEDDIKSELYSSIKMALDSVGLLRVPNKKEWIICEDHCTKCKEVSIVHCEQTMEGKAVDIVIWDPVFGDNATRDYKKKHCIVLIELKQKCCARDLVRGLRHDARKVSEWCLQAEQVALVIGFCTEPLSKLKLEYKIVSGLSSSIEMGSRKRFAFAICCDGCADLTLSLQDDLKN
ncbi:MAG: hypothetical protein JW384_02125 [Nitrosomonadaceae bacterium]|nr:hypothetical protein [Nitrosomonadaceae bacterium]